MAPHAPMVLVAAACALALLRSAQAGVVLGQPLLLHQAGGRLPVREAEKGQDLSKVPGTPGLDYPTYHEVPPTSFSCDHVPALPGIYANVETGCQAYHVCHDGREGPQGASFLCTNGTLFNQHEFACDWWYNVDCSQAPSLYSLNLDPVKNPYAPKPKPEEAVLLPHGGK
ncbi:hypothetical protein R5R35_014430 [Gryllus longicercus]|uniref:Chitin-binding type-2 domain-containing protein n=1 Tax=Gryllus longicercus TaxID=2509291 RepID=A0AAN9VZT4_9ORTH